MELAVITIACVALLALSSPLWSKSKPHLLAKSRQMTPLKTDITITPRKENSFDSFHQVPVTELYTKE